VPYSLSLYRASLSCEGPLSVGLEGRLVEGRLEGLLAVGLWGRLEGRLEGLLAVGLGGRLEGRLEGRLSDALEREGLDGLESESRFSLKLLRSRGLGDEADKPLSTSLLNRLSSVVSLRSGDAVVTGLVMVVVGAVVEEEAQTMREFLNEHRGDSSSPMMTSDVWLVMGFSWLYTVFRLWMSSISTPSDGRIGLLWLNLMDFLLLSL
jgi:hypothetical protein